LIKEFKNLTWANNNTYNNTETNSSPKIINTIHMLSNEQGLLNGKKEIINTLKSVGLPLDPKLLINHKNLNQMYLGLQYADQILMVSNSFSKSVIHGEDYGLGAIFNFLNKQNRINAINNGIVIKSFDANLIENLGKYAINHKDPLDITRDKKLIKQFLNNKYTNLNNDSEVLWFLYVGRFAQEKGIDLLPSALETIAEKSGNLIVIGCYVAEKSHNTNIQNIINHLKEQPHVVVIDNYQEQCFFGKYFRAACDFTITPSYQEACGLIPMEAMANYSIPLSSDVQGLQDTVIQLNDTSTEGTGFVYHNDKKIVKSNLQNIIRIAQNKYLNWQTENQINPLLFRLHKHAKSLDWQNVPAKKYLELYAKTMATNNQNTPYIIKKFPIIKVLHVALEYNQASLGGIGTVTTQLIQAQNKFANTSKLKASIITPYYLMFTENAKYLKEIKHFYNNEQVSSEIYLIEKEKTKHYLVKPKQHVLFNCNQTQQIYKNNNDLLIKRIQYFNTAVASFIANYLMWQIDLIQLHDWPTAITAVLLKKSYNIYHKQIIYTMHINNTDSGVYTNQQLNGINIDFSKPIYSLKQLGIEYSDYLITVSANLLQQCESIENPHKLFKDLNKSFLFKKYTKNSSSILNGIDFYKYCPLDKLIDDPSDLVLSKYKIKQKLASMLSGNYSLWKIDLNLPVILYVGRFSKEKGIDCFKKIIKILEKKAIFFAIGKGINKEILEVIMQSSRQQDNVFITFSEIEQQQYGDLMRAAADFSFVPSYEEACGLVAMEGLANGAMCITSGVGGLKDFI
ncbi:MAG: glycosyltransferase, partial [Gammaproteobacteria bacterium]